MTGCGRVLLAIALGQAAAALGQPFHLPTPNQAIFEAGKEAGYFTPTIGRTWPSGLRGQQVQKRTLVAQIPAIITGAFL